MNFDFVFFQLNPAGSLLNPVELSLLRSQDKVVCIPRELRELSWPTSLTNIRRKTTANRKNKLVCNLKQQAAGNPSSPDCGGGAEGG